MPCGDVRLRGGTGRQLRRAPTSPPCRPAIASTWNGRCVSGIGWAGIFVQGHVDGVGRVERHLRQGGMAERLVLLAGESWSHMVSKGSVAVDGVSLTLVDVEANGFSVQRFDPAHAGAHHAGVQGYRGSGQPGDGCAGGVRVEVRWATGRRCPAPRSYFLIHTLDEGVRIDVGRPEPPHCSESSPAE